MPGRLIHIPCMQCLSESLNNHRIPDSIYYDVLMCESGVVIFDCINGHKNAVVIDEQSFEILMEIAVENIIDKYYRESIVNFASAQERCFEFVCKLILFEKEKENVDMDDFWKKIYKSSSERQLGAFYALYAIRFKNRLPYNEKMIKLRNDVVHKGKIASKEEAMAYGRYVVNNIYSIIEDVVTNVDHEVLCEFKSMLLNDKVKRAKANTENMSMLNGAIVSWRLATDEELEQERKLQEYSRLNPKMYAQKAAEANRVGGKTLKVDDDGNLILVDVKMLTSNRSNEKYVGKKSLEELIDSVQKSANYFDLVKRNLVERAVIVEHIN